MENVENNRRVALADSTKTIVVNGKSILLRPLTYNDLAEMESKFDIVLISGKIGGLTLAGGILAQLGGYDTLKEANDDIEKEMNESGNLDLINELSECYAKSVFFTNALKKAKETQKK